jgi:hypothetical protein
MKNEIKKVLTEQEARSVRSAIEDCNRYIAKESPRSADLRPADVAKRLEWYIAHRAKLLAML